MMREEIIYIYINRERERERVGRRVNLVVGQITVVDKRPQRWTFVFGHVGLNPQSKELAS